jgi:hypothetical protein
MGEKSLLELVRACILRQAVNHAGVETMALLRNPIMAQRQEDVKVVHIRFDGRSLDVPHGDLDVGRIGG